jgi:CRP-like cAMP-binding protein
VARRIPPKHYLFKVDDTSDGVFLVRRGKVALLVDELPHLDRVFLAGSVVGLPSTFTGNAYSLTAVTLADSEIVHVPRDEFLELMSRDSTLCREATEILSRELSFIQAALAQRGEPKRQFKRPNWKSKGAGKGVLAQRFAKR